MKNQCSYCLPLINFSCSVPWRRRRKRRGRIKKKKGKKGKKGKKNPSRNVCGNKATERMCVSKQAKGCRDSTQHLESTILDQIRSMRISSSMTLETWGIPVCGTAPRWPPDIRIWPAHRFGRRVEREEEILRRGILFTTSYYDLYCSSSAHPGLLNLNATLRGRGCLFLCTYQLGPIHTYWLK